MKRILFLLLLAFLGATLHAQLSFVWAESAGCNSISYNDQGQGISCDDAGNSYVAGYFAETAVFGSITLTSNGPGDIFVAKLSTNGNWLWAKRAGGPNFDYGYAISTDSSGNSYVTGSYIGTADFGAYSLTSSGNQDVFVAKLDTAGNWLWVSSAGGTSVDIGKGISLDSSGNSFVTGYFKTTAFFGTTELTCSGTEDIFIAKLDISGNWLWAKRSGGTTDDEGRGVSTDSSGNCYVTGYFRGSSNFGSLLSSMDGSKDVFIAKLDTSGNWLWARRAGGSDKDVGWGVSTNSDGISYITGEFMYTAVYGDTSLTSLGVEDAFIAGLDANGNWLWATRSGSTGDDRGTAISADSGGNCWVTGFYTGTVAFGSTSLTSQGDQDVFIARLDSAGNWLGASGAGGADFDYGYAIAAGSGDSGYITGAYQDLANFGDTALSSLGNYDIFAAKLSRPAEPGIPLSPQNLTITRVGNDIHLTWDPVTQDTNGDPLTVSQYRVYYGSTDPLGTFVPLVLVSATSWSHTGAAAQAHRFYLVRAVVPD